MAGPRAASAGSRAHGAEAVNRAEAWAALSPEVQADLRLLLADPMLDASRGISLKVAGEVVYGEPWRGECAVVQADPWNLWVDRREAAKGRR